MKYSKKNALVFSKYEQYTWKKFFVDLHRPPGNCRDNTSTQAKTSLITLSFDNI
jgi:hypothetical protein